jgi:hypothetical protein
MWKACNAVAIDIRGAKGLNQSTINGVYEPTEEVCSGWPVYRKRGDANKWLEFFIASNKVSSQPVTTDLTFFELLSQTTSIRIWLYTVVHKSDH